MEGNNAVKIAGSICHAERDVSWTEVFELLNKLGYMFIGEVENVKFYDEGDLVD